MARRRSWKSTAACDPLGSSVMTRFVAILWNATVSPAGRAVCRILFCSARCSCRTVWICGLLSSALVVSPLNCVCPWPKTRSYSLRRSDDAAGAG